jgi:hypothetical protein
VLGKPIQAVNHMQVDHMLYSAKKTTPMPLNCQPLPLAQAALLSMASQRVITFLAPTIKSSNPSPLTSPALETDQLFLKYWAIVAMKSLPLALMV